MLSVQRGLFQILSKPKIVPQQCRAFASGSKKKRERTALVVGCSGALGEEIVTHLHENNIIQRIIGADIVPPKSEKLVNDKFDHKQSMAHFIGLYNTFHGDDAEDLDMDPQTLSGLTYLLESGMQSYEEKETEASNEHEAFEGEEDESRNIVALDAIICSAGGWIPTSDYTSPDYLLGVEQMLAQNLFPVVAASHIAASRLKPGGLFVVFGAAAALAPTPGMLAYGISKAAVHHVVQTLGSGKRELVARATGQISPTIVGLLPGTLDTPNNRKFAPPDTDFSQWTKLPHIANEIGQWITTPDLRPHTGSLIKVFPSKTGDSAVFRLVR